MVCVAAPGNAKQRYLQPPCQHDTVSHQFIAHGLADSFYQIHNLFFRAGVYRVLVPKRKRLHLSRDCWAALEKQDNSIAKKHENKRVAIVRDLPESFLSAPRQMAADFVEARTLRAVLSVLAVKGPTCLRMAYLVASGPFCVKKACGSLTGVRFVIFAPALCDANERSVAAVRSRKSPC